MNRNELACNLLKEYDNKWGYVANAIQDRAEEVLTERQFYNFLVKSNNDNFSCEGQDGVYFNGEYFDWKEYETKSKEIILAFLKYFTNAQLKKMYA